MPSSRLIVDKIKNLSSNILQKAIKISSVAQWSGFWERTQGVAGLILILISTSDAWFSFKATPTKTPAALPLYWFGGTPRLGSSPG